MNQMKNNNLTSLKESLKNALNDFLDKPTDKNQIVFNEIASSYRDMWISEQGNTISNNYEDRTKFVNAIDEYVGLQEKINKDNAKNPLEYENDFKELIQLIEDTDKWLEKRDPDKQMNALQKMNTITHRHTKFLYRFGLEIDSSGEEIIQISTKRLNLPTALFHEYDIPLGNTVLPDGDGDIVLPLAGNLIPKNNIDDGKIKQGWVKYTTHSFNSLVSTETEGKKGNMAGIVFTRKQNRRWYFKDKEPWFVKKSIMMNLFKSIIQNNELRSNVSFSGLGNKIDICNSANDDFRIKNLINVISSDSLNIDAQQKYWSEITIPLEHKRLKQLSNLKFIIIESAYHKTNRQIVRDRRSKWRDVVIFNDAFITIRSLTNDSTHVPAVGEIDDLRNHGITSSLNGISDNYWVMSNNMPEISNQSLKTIIERLIEDEKNNVIKLYKEGNSQIEISNSTDIDILEITSYLKKENILNKGDDIF